MKRILVTGSCGFIGNRCLARLLDKGYDVHGAARELREIDSRVTMHKTDVLDEREIDELLIKVKPTHVLHAAWMTTPGIFWDSTQNYRWFQKGAFFIDRFYQLGGERFVGVGSCAEYAPQPDSACGEQTTPIVPASLYGATKAALSFALQSAALAHQRSFAWARVFFPYGRGEPAQKLISQLLASLNAGNVPELRDPTRRLDFIHVDDVAEALTAIVDSSLEGAVNVSSGQAVSLHEVLALIINSFYPSFASALLTTGPPVATGQPNVYGDIRKLSSETGFTPRTSLYVGINEMR